MKIMENNKNQNQTTEFENPVNTEVKKTGTAKKVGIGAAIIIALTAGGYFLYKKFKK